MVPVSIDLTEDSGDEQGSPRGGGGGSNGDGDVASAYDEFDEEMRRAIEMSLKARFGASLRSFHFLRSTSS